MAGLAAGFPILNGMEQHQIALVRRPMVYHCGGCNPSLSLAPLTERVLSKEYHSAIAPGSGFVEVAPALRFLASAIASHGPQTTKPALRAGVGVRDCGLCLAVTQTLSNVKTPPPSA
jgi:hypothetical protein